MASAKFDKLVFEVFKDVDSYEKIKHQMKRVREIMLREHPITFKRLSIQLQFEYCCTIATIAANTATHNLNKLSTFSRRKEDSEFKFSTEAGFKEPKPIEIASNNFKRLN